jgi:hypothetical protein
MQRSLQSRAVVVAVLTAFLCQSVLGQDAQKQDAQKKDATREAKGVPPRAAPGDYQAHEQAGATTIAAEFTGHALPTPEAVLSTDDYVVVEVGLFGPAEARLKLSFDDFSLRINGKKMPSPAQPYGVVFQSLKDPEWEASVPAESKSKTSFGTGGRGQGSTDSTPAPVHMPIELKRVMQERVQKASLPEGERALPVAGLIYFPYGGKAQGIRSIELIYSGAAGKATLALHP